MVSGKYLGLGLRLRAERERLGLSLVEVAPALALRQAVVAALEREAWGDLPEAVLTEGYLRNYARLLERCSACLRWPDGERVGSWYARH